jgi:hypothetical protein
VGRPGGRPPTGKVGMAHVICHVEGSTVEPPKFKAEHFPNSMCVVKSFPIHVRRFSRNGRGGSSRGCSDEGEREGQELTSECVLTTPIRSLQHKHCSFKYDQDRHVHRRP